MNTQSLPLWVQMLGMLYMAAGILRLLCHLPQALRCGRSAESAAGVSILTWCGLLGCGSIAFIYAVLVVRDWPLMVSTACNVIGPMLVIASALRARRRHRRPR